MSTEEPRERERSEADFVDRHERLINAAVRDVWSRCSREMSLEEMRNCAWEGLLRARESFDSGEETEFETYAHLRIRGAVLDGCRRARWAPRRRRFEVRDDVTAAGLQGDGEQAEMIEVPPEISESHVRLMLMEPSELQELDLEAAGERGSEVARDELRSIVNEALDELGEIGRAVVRLYDVEGSTYAEIAEEFGCSRGWAARLRERALAEMRDYVEEALAEEPVEASHWREAA